MEPSTSPLIERLSCPCVGASPGEMMLIEVVDGIEPMASLKVMSSLSPDCILAFPFELVTETTTGEAASAGTVAANVDRLPAVSPTQPDIALRATVKVPVEVAVT